jgi:hypothetical protein
VLQNKKQNKKSRTRKAELSFRAYTAAALFASEPTKSFRAYTAAA